MVSSRAVLLLALALAACSGNSSSRDPSPPALPSSASGVPTAGIPSVESGSTPAPATLAAGALMELVPTAAELPAGFTAVEGAAGPVDAATVADLDPDPAAATAALRANGFRDGYSAEYSHPDDGSFVSVLVSRYADGPSARTDFARLAGATRPPARVERIETIGDESHASREAVVEGDVAEIVSVRFRVRDLVWLVEVGGQPEADDTLAKNIAKTLVRRTL